MKRIHLTRLKIASALLVALLVVGVLATTQAFAIVADPNASAGTVYRANATLDEIGLTATDNGISKTSVPANVQTWLAECDGAGNGAFLYTHLFNGNYVTYIYYNSGGHYPWKVDYSNGSLDFNLLTDRMKGNEGYTLIQCQLPQQIDIGVSVDGTKNGGQMHQGPAAPTNITPAVAELISSISFDRSTGKLSITVPQSGALSLNVTGRLYNHENSMKQTWPPFSEASQNGWQAGKSYEGIVRLQDVDYIEIAGSIAEAASTPASEFVVLIAQSGTIIQCDKVPADGEKDAYYQTLLR